MTQVSFCMRSIMAHTPGPLYYINPCSDIRMSVCWSARAQFSIPNSFPASHPWQHTYHCVETRCNLECTYDGCVAAENKSRFVLWVYCTHVPNCTWCTHNNWCIVETCSFLVPLTPYSMWISMHLAKHFEQGKCCGLQTKVWSASLAEIHMFCDSDPDL